MAVTWNPADKSDNITLSGGDLIATASNTNWKSVRATDGYAGGKHYFEVLVNVTLSVYAMIGVGTTAATLLNYVGKDAGGWSYNNSSPARKFHSSTPTDYGDSYADGDVVQVAVDMDAGKIWFGRNGTWNGDPAAGTGEAYSGLSGTVYPMYSPYQTNNNATLRALASSFSYTIPSGFSAWESAASFDLAGVAAIVSTATGAVSSTLPLAGTAASLVTIAGDLYMSIGLAGTAAGQATGTADLNDGNSNVLAGAAVIEATATASLAMTFTFAGSALASALASATLQRDDDILAGSAAVAATATATLSNSMSLAGAADVVVLAGGNVVMTVSFTGDAAAQAAASGLLGILVQIDGAALSESLAEALLFIGDPWSGLTLEKYTLRPAERNYLLSANERNYTLAAAA